MIMTKSFKKRIVVFISSTICSSNLFLLLLL